MASSAVEEYLQAIYTLADESGHVVSARLAELLGFSAPAVSEMVHRLERDGLVASRPGQGTFVTKAAHAIPVTAHTALRRSLERWIRSAREAGLDRENIRAIVSTTLQESEDKVGIA